MDNSIDVLSYKSQGLDNKLIAQAIGCDVEEVPSLIEKALKTQYGSSEIPAAVLVELTRTDRLIAKMFDDLDSCDDVYSEITGKLERDGYKMRATIVTAIDRLINTKIKLFNLSLIYKVATEEKEEATVDVNSMTLEQKLDKFRSLLEE